MADLTGVWQSTDKRETRHVYVTRVSAQYAFGFRCDARGMRTPGGGEWRWLLNGRRDGLQRYRRPERQHPPQTVVVTGHDGTPAGLLDERDGTWMEAP